MFLLIGHDGCLQNPQGHRYIDNFLNTVMPEVANDATETTEPLGDSDTTVMPYVIDEATENADSHAETTSTRVGGVYEAIQEVGEGLMQQPRMVIS